MSIRFLFIATAFGLCLPSTVFATTAQGTKTVAVILVDFQNNPLPPPYLPQPLTVEAAQQVMFTASPSVESYAEDISGGRFHIAGKNAPDGTGDVYGRITIPYENTGCHEDVWAASAKQLVGSALNGYDYLIYAFPSNSCSHSGLAVGTKTIYIDDSESAFIPYVIFHEIGHLLGLGHAAFLQCIAPEVAYGSCTTKTTEDVFSVMGYNNRMISMNAPEKERLGWLGAEDVTTVTEDGAYTINTYEGSVAPKVIKVPQTISSTGLVTSWYYLEYRRPVGVDDVSWANSENIRLGITTGVLVHKKSVSSGAQPYLLDMTPGSADGFFDAALQVGATYTDETTGITMTPTARTDGTITVQVRFGSVRPCTLNAPKLKFIAPSKSAVRGTANNYVLEVTNTSHGCGNRVLTIKPVTTEKGWSLYVKGLKTLSVTLKDGQKKRIAVKIVSPRTTSIRGHYFSFTATMKDDITETARAVARFVVKKR